MKGVEVVIHTHILRVLKKLTSKPLANCILVYTHWSLKCKRERASLASHPPRIYILHGIQVCSIHIKLFSAKSARLRISLHPRSDHFCCVAFASNISTYGNIKWLETTMAKSQVNNLIIS